jgi:hypothetical protein
MSVGAIGGRERVEAAIRGAADATGVDFDFLLRTAKRESALNPAAKARTSSATGLFQFVEQTWLSMVKKHGAKHGYGAYADLIDRGPGGRLTVSGDDRRKVLDLRLDARAASLMAGELASDHAAYLRGRIGREPTSGELYAAHFLGPAGSAKLIVAHEATPQAQAVTLFPAAAAANRTIFYKAGRPASVAELYANLTRSGGSQPTTTPPTRSAPPVRDVITVAALKDIVAPVSAGARDVAAPLVEAARFVRDAAAHAQRSPIAAAHSFGRPDAAQAALSRAERSRRDALLVDLVLGESGRGGLSASPLSMELLTLLSAARDR